MAGVSSSIDFKRTIPVVVSSQPPIILRLVQCGLCNIVTMSFIIYQRIWHSIEVSSRKRWPSSVLSPCVHIQTYLNLQSCYNVILGGSGLLAVAGYRLRPLLLTSAEGTGFSLRCKQQAMVLPVSGLVFQIQL